MSWHKAQAKIRKGKNYTDTVEVPFVDPETGETTHIDLHYRLPSETEQLKVQQAVDFSELEDVNQGEDIVEAQERVRELQAKDDLTPAEEQELQEQMRVVQQNEAELMSAMGEEMFDAILDLGKTCLTATDEDVNAAFEQDPATQRERFNFIPETRDDMREALELEQNTLLEEQPYPVKFTVGMAAFDESQSLLDDTDLDEGNQQSGE